jgi:iron(III) transport system permease protein
VIFPLLKGSIMTSFIVIFIETLKELPLTMILRPFNFDTLPVLSHELVTQAQVIESAVPAMFIVLFGMVSVLVLVKKMVKD